MDTTTTVTVTDSLRSRLDELVYGRGLTLPEALTRIEMESAGRGCPAESLRTRR